MNTSLGLRRWLGVCIRDIDVVLNRDLAKRDDASLLDEFVAEVQDEEDRDVDV